MHISIVSSFPPRQSGIAEFNRDLITHLKNIDPSIVVEGIAINETNDNIDSYPSYVISQVRKNCVEDYRKAALKINASEVDFVLIQHEFSQYGGYNGEYILELITHLKKPIICIPHTVPVRKDAHKIVSRKKFFIMVDPFITQYITLLDDAKNKLISYGIASSKISTVPHGVPDILYHDKVNLRKKLNLSEDDFIVFSFGFMHKNKGTIYSVNAMKEVKEQNRNCKLLICSSLLNSQSSIDYALTLQKEIEINGLSTNVIINTQYLKETEIFDYINAADIGLVPYIYHSYTASGPLSFFIGAGKPVIVTRFAYASSILNKEAAYFVPFENAHSIAQGIIKLAINKNYYQKLQVGMLKVRERLLWVKTANEYYKIFSKILK